MKTCGIIVEYNPFHNGHKYHIQKARELTNADYIIAVLSTYVCQRGDLSVLNKFEKAKIALENDVDLVIELPFVYTVQNATVFAHGAISILKKLNVDYICFGSETNNLENLIEIANTSINPNHLKEAMNQGLSYPKAYSLLANSLYPNDILAVAYLKELNNSKIKPIAIQRTSDYHSNTLKEITSAKAIREAILHQKDYSVGTDVKINNPIFLKDLYPYIRKRLLLSNPCDLAKIHLVSEGIEKLLIKNALKYDNFDDFINNSISKRYTKSRIQRILIWILLDIKEDDLPKDDIYIRALGFKKKTQELLKYYKNQDINIITQFKNIPKDYKDIEYKVTLLYALAFEDLDYSQYLIKRELKGPIIID